MNRLGFLKGAAVATVVPAVDLTARTLRRFDENHVEVSRSEPVYLHNFEIHNYSDHPAVVVGQDNVAISGAHVRQHSAKAPAMLFGPGNYKTGGITL